MRKTPVLSLALATTLAVATAAAGQTENTSPTFEGLVEVSEVLIDVLATGQDGQLVAGLGKSDFIVEEDGRPVDLKSVSYYSTRYDDEGAEEGEVPSSRYLVLFFHDTVLQGKFEPRAIRQQFSAARKSQDWVETELRGSDWVAVVSYDYRLKVHQDFTQDRDSILFAIEQAISRKNIDKNPSRLRPPSGGVPSLLRYMPEGKELSRGTRNIYGALHVLAESTGYIVGRKNLLLFTSGFGQTAVLPRTRQKRHYDKMESALNDHNIAVYPIHLGGRGVGQPHSFFLAQLAEDTGGVYYENFHDFAKPLARIGDENYGYYVLSYQSEHPAGEIGYERIEVRARDESIQVRARKGYRYGL